MEIPKVLVVDDELEVLQNLKSIVSHMIECQIDDANNGNDAILKMQENDYDLVILDIKMPEASGIDAMRKIKETKSLPDILVITAYDSASIAEEVVSEGAVDYIPKPIYPDNLKLKIKQILEPKNMYKGKE